MHDNITAPRAPSMTEDLPAWAMAAIIAAGGVVDATEPEQRDFYLERVLAALSGPDVPRWARVEVDLPPWWQRRDGWTSGDVTPERSPRGFDAAGRCRGVEIAPSAWSGCNAAETGARDCPTCGDPAALAGEVAR